MRKQDASLFVLSFIEEEFRMLALLVYKEFVHLRTMRIHNQKYYPQSKRVIANIEKILT